MFITLEGIEGAGKTSQIPNIKKFLLSRGFTLITTKEPGGSFLGKKIREILLDPENKKISPLSEMLLYQADRAHHVKDIIEPAIKAGKTVLCDRFTDATLAYQGFARNLDIDNIKMLNKLVTKKIVPDLTILFDLSPEIGLRRAWEQIDCGERSNKETRFEKENLLFHEKVRAGYLKILEFEPKRFRIVDASKNFDNVWNQIRSILLTYIKERGQNNFRNYT